MIYLDNAATTPTSIKVIKAMLPYIISDFGNPSGIYDFARNSREAVSVARGQIAEVINCNPEEIYFTSGGSESDNWAIKGLIRPDKNHIVTSKIEHHAILNTCRYLEKTHKVKVTYLDVDESGFVDLKQLRSSITNKTALVSVMFANNEIGTIEPIKEIAEIVHEKGCLFHTDAVQAFGQIPIDVNELGIDMLSASAHKLNGPKGIGSLYIRDGIEIDPLIHGGQQELGLRAGTENVPGIVGFGVAAQIASHTMDKKIERELQLRDLLIGKLKESFPEMKINGSLKDRLPNNVNISFDGLDGESLLILLDDDGICASSGSACASESGEPSHVLLAIGRTPEEARGSIRLTLSDSTTEKEIDYVVKVIEKNLILLGMRP